MRIKNIKEFAELIRETRKKQGLTQSQLALASNVGLRYIVDLEKGKPTCQIGKALQIIEMLGISLEAE